MHQAIACFISKSGNNFEYFFYKFINININAQSEQKDEEVEVCAESLIRPGLGEGRWVCVKKDLSVSCKWLVVTFEFIT